MNLVTNLHFVELSVDMVGVHVEIMTLEGVSIHACVDRVKVGVFLRVGVEIDDHLVSCDVSRLEYNILPVSAEFYATHIRRVAVAAVRNITMEKELQRSFRPGQIRVLTAMKVAPNPILRIL